MLRKSIKCFIVVVLILCTIITGNVMVALAVTQSDLDDAQQKIDSTKNEIEQVERELSATMTQIQSLNAEIATYENEISDLNSKIDEVSSQITAAEEQLKAAEEQFEHQKELLQIRLVALYESGQTSFLDVLLSADSMTDFISKYYIVSEIAENDKNLLEQIEINKNSIEETKKMLEASKEQIETLKANKQATANSLQNSKDVKQGYVNQLNEEEQALQEDLEEFERDKREIQAELERIARENNGGSTVIAGEPSAAGYIFPVAGLNIYNINRRYYPSYPGHTGVDVNINVRGKSIVAVKSGTVVISTALKRADGTYRSYGEYVVIDHHDGTMTLYAHMLPNSRQVSKGQSVSQGQVLGTVGTTGNSTGLHLHFEVRVNGRCVNPLPYLQ